ncbi:uncharacterized protein A1O9_10161 [Exophiala aquamarina CBS 119918]|uniref:Glycosyltransferase 2-like domain-containing protein n=1 Tax=Exophiala aquamarina CBS 119918 TaxID=1182545 RepID=A0A072PDZ6_9EURO|nr:uncharacterized protein A1O9_10161 [Exophiala aquamarina CBS 119918]KEF53760.1 hypothetical protein A1O9_10161 [Exophiala aquamarina CBS 119918]
MAIIIPSYKEEVEILEASLRVLASHRYAKTSYDVFLAMEQRDPNAAAVATSLSHLFKHKFRDLQVTLHPSDIPGEAPGKSSNVSWAAKAVERKYVNSSSWTDVLITVMDSDTHLLSKYFELIFWHHLRSRGEIGLSDITFYMAPIVFDRNSNQVPRLVRMADLMWCGAGLSCFNGTLRRNAVAIPTAVYTVSLSLACLAGGWDSGPEAIGEDMHMLLKCYFATGGHLHTISIPSPASQCNVSTGKEGVRGWVANHQARYSQGLRHMWGSLDTGFAVRQWLRLSKPPETDDSRPSAREAPLPPHVLLRLKLGQYSSHRGEVNKYTWRNLILFTRLFEAHFLPNHLFLVLVASAVYASLPYPISHCRILSITLDITSYMRAIGFALMTIYFVIFYERYHQVCVEAREQEMRRVGLYEELEIEFSRRKRWTLASIIDYFVFPISGTVFGSVPLLQAIVSHFWTDKLVYVVSAKPVKAGGQGQKEQEANA